MWGLIAGAIGLLVLGASAIKDGDSAPSTKPPEGDGKKPEGSGALRKGMSLEEAFAEGEKSGAKKQTDLFKADKARRDEIREETRREMRALGLTTVAPKAKPKPEETAS